jgi:hypothetical protein
LIECIEFPVPVEGTLEGIEIAAQLGASIESPDFPRIAQADIGDREIGSVGIAGDGEGGVGVTDVCWAVVLQRWVDPDIPRQGMRCRGPSFERR